MTTKQLKTNQKSDRRDIWLSLAVVFALLAWAAIGFLPDGPHGLVMAGPASDQESSKQADAVDVNTYFGIQQLRKDVGLGRQDMIRKRMTQEQASAMLTSVKTWHEGNQADYIQRKQAVNTARANLRQAYEKANKGESVSPTEISRAKEDSDRAVRELSDFLAQARSDLGLPREDENNIRSVSPQIQTQSLSVQSMSMMSSQPVQVTSGVKAIVAAEESVLPVPVELIDFDVEDEY